MDFLKTPLLLRLARGLAVLFALSVLIALVSCAHRQSNPPAPAPAPAAAKTETISPAAPAVVVPVSDPYISSSKSLSPPVPRPRPASSTKAPADSPTVPAPAPASGAAVPSNPRAPEFRILTSEEISDLYLSSSKSGPFIRPKKKEPQRKKQK